MNEKSEKLGLKYYGGAFLAASLATYAMCRKGNYRVAFLFYSRCGGGGLNFYKQQENGKLHRFFAIDYHSFWDHTKKEKVKKLHYHRGENASQMKKHRPYEGGW
ncbi:hypothetical protein EP47_04420 [Legionella norrlandica]|uniref:Uncharacterized protein n=1 Tax=Legionella norrlandica TaxID=1498499 RepID=A0A0A2T6Z9_9GAMM|nr:hypothetical protein [Legionella norrlandica]KGP63213.1 hypothetical protein EP47_04420 [Legionella norrlandica]